MATLNEPVPCRSCAAPVLYMTNRKTGKKIPINVEPKAGGGIVLLDERRFDVRSGEGTHQSHFATCPRASEWRQKP